MVKAFERGKDAAGGEFKEWYDWECETATCKHFGMRVVGANPNCSQCGARMRRLGQGSTTRFERGEVSKR